MIYLQYIYINIYIYYILYIIYIFIQYPPSPNLLGHAMRSLRSRRAQLLTVLAMSLDYSVLRPNDGATGMGGFGVHGAPTGLASISGWWLEHGLDFFFKDRYLS